MRKKLVVFITSLLLLCDVSVARTYANYGNDLTKTEEKNSLALSNLVIKDKDKLGYTVEANIDVNAGITRIAFPTWTTSNGQDDVAWLDGVISSNKVTFRVNVKEHNYENGEYNTHLYIYKDNEVISIAAINPQYIEKSNSSIYNLQITNKDATGYTVEAELKSDYGFDKISFPTWTTKNGQDDVKWLNGTISGNKVSFRVDVKNHKYEFGEYNTHIYAYDNAGTEIVAAIQPQNIGKSNSSIYNLQVTNKDARGYTVEAELKSDYGFSKVSFPTWTTKNGQDDVKWLNGTISGNKVSFRVDVKNHKYEFGEYNTHIYAYDNSGTEIVAAIQPQNIGKSNSSIYNLQVTNKDAKGYTVEAELKSDYGFSKVSFPTWTTKNGQDDVKWLNGTISGNKVSFRVNVKDHKYEFGEYNTHIYAYDNAGTEIVATIQPQNIISSYPEISNIRVTNKDATGYTVEADLKSDYGVNKVSFPTWTTRNGQDDVKWFDGEVVGNHVTFRVDIKNHNYEDAEYNTHIYLHDKVGSISVASVPPITITNEIPIISNVIISEVTSWGYTVTADVNDDIGIKNVSFPTWTTKNGQDDVKWLNGTVIGKKVSFRVDVKDHNYEAGDYLTHIYAYDLGGKMSVYAIPTVNVKIQSSSGWTYRDGKKLLFDKSGNIVEGASKLVIDISEHNGNIDWEKVKASGVDSVILRCGYGWADDLNEQIDKNFINNAKELERLNIPYGVYLFSYANTESGAIKEANYTLRLIEGRKISLPVYYDLEYSSYAGDISSSTYTKMAHAFCNKIEKAGYAAGIYANLNYWKTKLNDVSLDRYTKWVAQYNSNDGQAGHCDYNKEFKVWQYTSVGSVSGIGGNVDMNAWFGE